ncbi:BZ3500_MvSof-1268-A1-R1_Chr2-2g05103 [Microbotryum saponariae]|uniref:uridine/cytidine kinase n=1 Tax=Microbotryum saponariae TaxID=289078 RepID=A0A2X0N7U8_9BASI|nr:BZ3500_MvSof-1268-A1-R1_Chr2-2g05103 [Microbotryum saponariae]SDA00917.1 BZ3501_MvSof-1269-A2-R1_Chr2-2g04777 [Microbotryum saponariae]
MPRSGPPAPLLSNGKSALLPKNTVLTEAGRPPWYDKDGRVQTAYVIGIGGGSASGKTRVAQEVLKKLSVPWVVVISQDSFYKPLTPEELSAAFRCEHDLDSPTSIDEALLRDCLGRLRAGEAVQLPNYSFAKHARTDETTYIYGATVVIVEGIHALHESLRDVYDLKVFVQCDSDLMLARRLRRDLVERGRDAAGVLDQLSAMLMNVYLRFVKPAFDNHIQPTSRFADIIVPGSNNEISVELIAGHIRRQLDERKQELRKELFVETEGANAKLGTNGEGGAGLVSQRSREISVDRLASKDGLPDTVVLMEQTNQLSGIHTLLRSSSTPAADFLFYANRLSTLVVERSLSLLPYRSKLITTRTSVPHTGQELDIDAGHLVGVSILRSGASLEKGLRRVVREIPVGSMLIQSDDQSGEPLLYSIRLPQALTRSKESAKKTWVLLLDSQIGTGAAALMAVRVLLDHGVDEAKIIICAILVSKLGGVWALKRAFPRVRIVSSAADDGLEERWEKKKDGSGSKKVFAILPGMGSFGDRYFVTS